MDQVSSARCKELLNLLRKITQAVDLHSKYLNKHFGLTGPQLGILQELANGEKTVSDLARSISLSQGTVTDIVHRLENKDLIIKRRGNRDKRQVLIALSEKCKDLLALAPPPLQEKFMSYFSQIEEWEQLMILSAMNRIVEMMSGDSVDASSQPGGGPVLRRRSAAGG
jgi:DNA-binding MarR family transcriptional regulator